MEDDVRTVTISASSITRMTVPPPAVQDKATTGSPGTIARSLPGTGEYLQRVGQCVEPRVVPPGLDGPTGIEVVPVGAALPEVHAPATRAAARQTTTKPQRRGRFTTSSCRNAQGL